MKIRLLFVLSFLLFVGCASSDKLSTVNSIGSIYTGLHSDFQGPIGLRISTNLEDIDGNRVIFNEDINIFLGITQISGDKLPLGNVYSEFLIIKNSDELRDIVILFEELESIVEDPSLAHHTAKITLYLPDGRELSKEEARIHQPIAE